MRKIFFALVMFISIIVFSQKNNGIKLKKKLFYGVELGTNRMPDFKTEAPKSSVQGGIFVEYYFAKQWSICTKVKYYETGVGFYKPNTHSGSWFDLGSDAYYGNFSGNVVNVPVFLKWEFRLYKNLKGNFKLGLSNNFETKSVYENYSPNLKTDYSKYYNSFIQSMGLTYFIDDKSAVYIDMDYDYGTSKGFSQGFFGNTHYSTTNQLVSFGYKYTFK